MAASDPSDSYRLSQTPRVSAFQPTPEKAPPLFPDRQPGDDDEVPPRLEPSSDGSPKPGITPNAKDVQSASQRGTGLDVQSSEVRIQKTLQFKDITNSSSSSELSGSDVPFS